MFHVIIIASKILFASLIVGAGLSLLDITALDVLAKAGLTPERVGQLLSKGFEWALPNIMLGSMVIIPIWVLTFMLRPPRG